MRTVFSLLLILVFSVNAQKAPFSIDALYKIKNVSDPQISPDGKRIAFVVTDYNLAEGKANSDIYLMDSDGRNQKRMTTNPTSDHQPRWSTDGKSLLFISDRGGSAQAWLLPADGGEARQITDFYTGVQSAEWVPGKNQIVFSSFIFPECGADNACNQEILKDMQNGPL
ncbi:MAG TPA: S9 family peptidase, partial [Caldithrix abyssi]|nr:S9 family peptidase [Caldithrix abyssi]